MNGFGHHKTMICDVFQALCAVFLPQERTDCIDRQDHTHKAHCFPDIALACECHNMVTCMTDCVLPANHILLQCFLAGHACFYSKSQTCAVSASLPASIGVCKSHDLSHMKTEVWVLQNYCKHSDKKASKFSSTEQT